MENLLSWLNQHKVNTDNLKIIDQIGANVYDILKYKNVIFTTTSIKTFQERNTK